MSVVQMRKAEEAVAEVIAESPRPVAVARPVTRPFDGAADTGKRAGEFLARPFIHLPAPSVSAVWAYHQAASQHWDNWPVVAWARLWLWGAPHTGVAAAVYGLLWVIRSPAGLAVLVVLALACRVWL